jgi:2-hydroxy-6-oxonona-2,4-dienedioate hydrolase
MLNKQLQEQIKAKMLEETMSRMRLIDLQGRKVQLMESGEGEPLLYLHSAYGENMWMPFHEKLAQNFRLLAPAHPGFALSQGIEEISSMEDLAFHYIDLLDQLNLEAVNLVGVSLGGWIAAEFATRYPHRVKRLALGAPAGLWLDEHPMTDMFAALNSTEKLRRINFHDPDSLLAQMLLPDEASDEEKAEAYKALSVTARLFWNPFGHNPKLAGRLRRITSPTLLLWGDDDRLIPQAYAGEWARHLRDAQVVTLADCGHLLMFEGESQFVAAVSDFLR